MSIKKHKQRFGVTAIKAGYITLDQLLEVIRMQVEFDIKGSDHKLIGEILVTMGYMEPSEVDQVLKIMEKANA